MLTVSYQNKITLLSRKYWQQTLKSCLMDSRPAGCTFACLSKAVEHIANLAPVISQSMMREECRVGEGGAPFSHLVPEHYFFSLAFPVAPALSQHFLLCLTFFSLPHLRWFLSSYCLCGPSNLVTEFCF